MAKREKIIIVLMIVAILYGAYSFFLSAPPDTVEENDGMDIAALNQFVVGAAQELFGEKSAEVDQYILDQAQAEWTQDPFFVSAQHLSAQRAAKEMAEEKPEEVHLSYMGYIEVADRRLAIINDLEYETGEALNQPGYYVKLITAKRVVLGIEGEIENVILPLEEQ